MKNGRLAIIAIGGLQFAHLFLEGLVVRRSGLAVFHIHGGQGIDVGSFTSRGGGIGSCELLGVLERQPSCCGVAVLPQPVIVGHGDAPLGHGARRILPGDFRECCSCLFVLKGVQERYRAVETYRNHLRAGSCELDGAYFFGGEFVVVFLGGQRQGGRAKQNGQKYRNAAHEVHSFTDAEMQNRGRRKSETSLTKSMFAADGQVNHEKRRAGRLP